MKSKTLDFHTISAAAISVLGSAVVYLPKANDNNPIFAMALALIIGLPVYIAFINLTNKINVKNDMLKKTFSVMLCLFLIYLAAKSFYSIADYFSSAVLPKTPHWLIIISIFLLVLYAVICGGDTVKKFTIIGFISVAVLLLVLALVSFKNLDISLMSEFQFNITFFETVVRYFGFLFVASADALIFQRKGGSEKSLLKSTVLGIAIGGLLLTLVIANSVLVFGEGYSAELRFPYSSAVATFSVGTLFTRLDGFAYFIILTINFLKGALCILSCEYLLSPFKIRKRKTLLFILCSISLLISLIL